MQNKIVKDLASAGIFHYQIQSLFSFNDLKQKKRVNWNPSMVLIKNEKYLKKFDYVWMVHCFHDSNLAKKLLKTTRIELSFINNFYGNLKIERILLK